MPLTTCTVCHTGKLHGFQESDGVRCRHCSPSLYSSSLVCSEAFMMADRRVSLTYGGIKAFQPVGKWAYKLKLAADCNDTTVSSPASYTQGRKLFVPGTTCRIRPRELAAAYALPDTATCSSIPNLGAGCRRFLRGFQEPSSLEALTILFMRAYARPLRLNVDSRKLAQ